MIRVRMSPVVFNLHLYYLNVLYLFSGNIRVLNAYVNIALNKPAHQLYPILGNDTFDASNAVDGRKSDLLYNGGQCAVSHNNQTATWWVDLNDELSIHHITIYFKTDNVRWDSYSEKIGYLGFFLYVSNTTDRLQGTLCYKDDNFTLDTIPAVFTTTCPVHGQYVIYHNERQPGVTYPNYYSDDVNSDLCEVEVYGCPTSGYYNGSDCCPDVNCQYCHIETGTCQGCGPGYRGRRCELECEQGLYGIGCSETCGHCRDVDQCFHVNGTCLTGCDTGYQDDLCKTPCDRGLYGMGCINTCGHCLDVYLCSYIDGTCLTGCAVDYQGELCNTGRWYINLNLCRFDKVYLWSAGYLIKLSNLL
nr:multiple epidermal growth factor-like domains protein 10 [Crassostrea gigas]